MPDRLLRNYDYFLPPDRIATHPANPRESAKLLVYDRQKDQITHSDFFHFFDFIDPKTLFVLNDTKVIKARLYGHKMHPYTQQIGGQVEIFYHRHIQEHQFLVQIRGKVKKGMKIILDASFHLLILECLPSGLRKVEFYCKNKLASISQVLEQIQTLGHIPLPPYIKRKDEALDEMQYQSVFASKLGAIAAPTASLHFSDIEYLKANYDYCFLTLHVGAGTFLSVETPNICDHPIHTESFFISSQNWKKIKDSNNILCVGTTSARVVEYLHRCDADLLEDEISGECDLFLHPFNPPQKIHALLTNFHLPKSTLIMLVSSMIGRKKCLEIYQEAIKNQYRFYSYGDGMLIL